MDRNNYVRKKFCDTEANLGTPVFPKELGPSGNFERQIKNQEKIIVPSLSSLIKLFGMSFTIGRNKQEGPTTLSIMT